LQSKAGQFLNRDVAEEYGALVQMSKWLATGSQATGGQAPSCQATGRAEPIEP